MNNDTLHDEVSDLGQLSREELVAIARDEYAIDDGTLFYMTEPEILDQIAAIEQHNRFA